MTLTIHNMKPPTSVKELQSYLEMLTTLINKHAGYSGLVIA